MDEKKRNVSLVSREQMQRVSDERFARAMGLESTDEIKKINVGNEEYYVKQFDGMEKAVAKHHLTSAEIAKKILITGAATIALASAINGLSSCNKTKTVVTDSPVYSEDSRSYRDTELHPMIDSMENSSFKKDNLVFDQLLRDEDGFSYRVVVSRDGKYAFVSEDYDRPCQDMHGVSAREAAESLGFDESELSNDMETGRSR